MVIKVKEVPIKVYNSVRKVERYYAPLRRIYKIISLELEVLDNLYSLKAWVTYTSHVHGARAL